MTTDSCRWLASSAHSSPSAPPSTTARTRSSRRISRGCESPATPPSAIPEELGGLGASLRQVCYAQAELARYCGATALAVNMHLHPHWPRSTAGSTARRTPANLLRRVAAERLILMSSGGSDGIWPSTTATRESGGFRVNGRKAFCSQAPVANVLSTFATL